MAFPAPIAGLVVRYSYLWRSEFLRGREEGIKDRPCAVLLATTDADGDTTVIALPVTHAPPRDPSHAVEIPAATKRRLGLDGARSWIVVAESNRFAWPGPDLRPARPGDPASVVYGELPGDLYEKVRAQWLALYAARRTHSVERTA